MAVRLNKENAREVWQQAFDKEFVDIVAHLMDVAYLADLIVSANDGWED